MPKRKLKALLVDLSGTLHIGTEPTPGAIAALKRVRDAKIPIRFCSNTTKDGSAALQEKLRKAGFDIPKDEIYTSLSAVRQLLVERSLRPLLLLSDSALRDFEATSPPYDAVVIGLAPDKIDYAHLNEAFRILSSTNDGEQQSSDRKHLIATHRALYYKSDNGKLSLGPGGFVSALEQAAEVQAEVVGKPTRSFFEACLKSLEVDGIAPADWKDVAMIGDDWRNDLGEGAEELGLERHLVKTGKYREGDEKRAQHLSGVHDSFASFVDAII